MIALLLAGAVSFMVALAGTPLLIRWLQTHGIGQQIREEGPSGHLTKAGTPTMGGLMIVAAAVIGYLPAHVRARTAFTLSGIAVILVIVGAATVGLIDDWLKVSRRNSDGLSKRLKLLGQLIVAGAFAVYAVHWLGVSTMLSFTRFDSLGVDLGPYLWGAFAVAVIMGASNAVNFTDGADGLAAGASAFAFSAFVVIGFWQFRHESVYHVLPARALDLAIVAMAMMGGCAGFLWWNAAPARIFMGDTGSLGIGAGLAALAFLMNLQLLLPIICGLMVMITLSVIIQIVSFRLFHRRVFRMAPIQHHFELIGWPETTVIVRFWILAGLTTALALGIFYADFIKLGGLD